MAKIPLILVTMFLLQTAAMTAQHTTEKPVTVQSTHAPQAAAGATASEATAPEATASEATASEATAPEATASADTGREAPAFVFRSLDDSSYISNAAVAGRVYLVDFWATWCPPCVEALPEMEKIYEEFHPRGFEIISLSFDNSDERIRQFRAKRFPMPWLHGRLAGGFGDIVAISFGVENIPHYVLVGSDGRIIAEGDDLHGERLRALLTGILEE